MQVTVVQRLQGIIFAGGRRERDCEPTVMVLMSAAVTRGWN